MIKLDLKELKELIDQELQFGLAHDIKPIDLINKLSSGAWRELLKDYEVLYAEVITTYTVNYNNRNQ